MNCKEFGYWASYIIPGVPTYNLIKEYRKDKSQRTQTKILAGYLGTAFLITKLALTLGGIITLNNLDFTKKNSINFEKENKLEQKVDSSKVISDGKIYFYDQTKHL